jgi:hypothetical protein
MNPIQLVSNPKKYYLVYQTTNIINNFIYVGVHATNELEDGYIGSGKRIIKAINEFGKENFKREILFFCNSKEEMLEKEKEIVNENFINRRDTYNIAIGGSNFDKSTGSNIGRIYISSADHSIQKMIHPEFLNDFLSKGWIIGRKLKQSKDWIKKRIQSSINNKTIFRSDESIKKRVETRIKNGNYKTTTESNKKRSDKLKGKPKSKEAILNYVNSRKQKGNYKMSELNKKLKSELEKGKIWITNSISEKRIKLQELNSFLLDGWERGRLKIK